MTAPHTAADADRGSVSIELVTIVVLLLMPVIYLVIAIGQVQAGTFATDTAAREAVRAIVTADDDADGYRRAQRAVELAFSDQGFDGADGTVLAVSCSHDPCLQPGARVSVEVSTVVPLPGFGSELRSDGIGVRIEGSHTMIVDRYASPGLTSD